MSVLHFVILFLHAYVLYTHFNVIASLVSAKFQIYLKSELYLTLTNLNNTLHILDLEPRQNYIVEIAALTSIGEGERSSVIVQTGDSECCSLVTVEHLLKETMDITSLQRTLSETPNIHSPIVLIHFHL